LATWLTVIQLKADVVIEAIPRFLGLLQLFALRELIDSFNQPIGSNKDYAYLMCGAMLAGQAFEGELEPCKKC
jgi:hypothetical protein